MLCPNQAVVTDTNRVTVTDVFSGSSEDIDLRERVVDLALDHGHLVIATPTHCSVYNVNNWNTPHVFDLRGLVSLILLSERYVRPSSSLPKLPHMLPLALTPPGRLSAYLTVYLLNSLSVWLSDCLPAYLPVCLSVHRQLVIVDNISGIQVYSYDGRLLCTPRFPGLRSEVLSAQTVAVGPDCVAVVDKSDGKSTRGVNRVLSLSCTTSSLRTLALGQSDVLALMLGSGSRTAQPSVCSTFERHILLASLTFTRTKL
jgi:intraflagellar transport protein 80